MKSQSLLFKAWWILLGFIFVALCAFGIVKGQTFDDIIVNNSATIDGSATTAINVEQSSGALSVEFDSAASYFESIFDANVGTSTTAHDLRFKNAGAANDIAIFRVVTDGTTDSGMIRFFTKATGGGTATSALDIDSANAAGFSGKVTMFGGIVNAPTATGTTLEVSRSGGQSSIAASAGASLGLMAINGYSGGDVTFNGYNTTGQVGFLTNVPTSDMHMIKSQNADTDFRIENTNNGTAARAMIRMTNNDASAYFYATSDAYSALSHWADSFVVATDTALTGGIKMFTPNRITFTTTASAAIEEHFNISSDGEVIIGATASDDADTILEVNGAITQVELSADPANPAEGKRVTWLSDGTGSGDDGDVMMKVSSGAATGTYTLIDRDKSGPNNYASVYVSAASASDAITATTYLNVLDNATIADAGVTTSGFTVDNTNKRITYTGTNTHVFDIEVSVSFVSSQSNEVSRFRLAKNGTTDVATEMARKIGTGSDEGALHVGGMFSLATNDYVELHATLDTSASDTITVNHANFAVDMVD